MRQTIVESCALDGEGFCFKRGGRTWACQGNGFYCKHNLADIRQRERLGPRLRGLKIGSLIRKEGRLGVN